MSRSLYCGLLAMAVCAAWPPTAPADITDITGAANVMVEKFVDGVVSDTVSASDQFPTTDATLPLQVIALLLPPKRPVSAPPGSAPPTDPNAAAAAGAAQLADPRDQLQPNPEDFAINLTLNSVSTRVSFSALASSKETRTVLFSPGELGPFSRAGDRAPLVGRLFLDGAIAIFGARADRDLTGAFARIKVQVQATDPNDQTVTVFDGAVELSGSAGGANVSSSGAFPVDTLILSDLSAIMPGFATFQLMVIPNITIDYPFSAVVGQPLKLEATVRVEAENLPDQTGVAVVLGAPTDTLQQVIGNTLGMPAATKMIQTITRERDTPTGEPAFPAAVAPLGLCGPLGFGALFALSYVVFVSGRRGAAARARRRPPPHSCRSAPPPGRAVTRPSRGS